MDHIHLTVLKCAHKKRTKKKRFDTHENKNDMWDICMKMIILYNNLWAVAVHGRQYGGSQENGTTKKRREKKKRFRISHLLKLNNMSVLYLVRMWYNIFMMPLLLPFHDHWLHQLLDVSFGTPFCLRSLKYLSRVRTKKWWNETRIQPFYLKEKTNEKKTDVINICLPFETNNQTHAHTHTQ